MRAGSQVYVIEAEVQGKPVPADLNHLERMLGEIGYSCKPSLAQLQDGTENVSQIHPSVFKASHVRRNDGAIELVSYYEDEKLDEFAKGYKPIPLSSPTQP